jgi:hypothetical protein
MVKIWSGIGKALLHSIALGFGAVSMYFLLGPNIELVMIALIMLGAAIAFEVIAAIVSEDRRAHT